MNKLLNKYNEVVNKRKNKILLKTHDGTYISYNDFDKKVNSLAKYLSIKFEYSEIIPVVSKNYLDYLITMIACWKIGKIYMPININIPSKKIKSILSSVGVGSILTDEFRYDLQSIDMVLIEYPNIQNFVYNIEVENEIAYILSTSGTSGNPKMVKVGFENLYWLLKSMNDIAPFLENDVFIISTPPQFDVSFHEMLSFIFGEGILQFIDSATPVIQFKKIKDLLINDKITHIALSPTSMKAILSMTKEKIKCSKLKTIILAGEILSVNLANQILKLLPSIKLLNCYGPTETTIYATYFIIDQFIKTKTVSIGTPINGVKIKFFNPKDNINDEKGEILIGGQGVSKGYYNNDRLTKEKFIKIKEEIFYKTGDIGFRENGKIYFEGRADKQIKINGIRIELEEIEQTIQMYIDNFINIVVLNIEDNLVLFSDKEIDYESIKMKLSKHLPSYMIPKFCIIIPQIKLTNNNKLDISYLTEEFKNKFYQKSNLFSNSKKTEIKKVISDILEDKNLSDNENLMLHPRLNSLTQIEIILSLEDIYDIDFPFDVLKKNQTITKLLNYIEKAINLNLNESKIDNDISKISYKNIFSNIKSINKLNNLVVMQNNYTCKDSFYLQKSYIVDNFNQILELNVTLPETINSIDDIEKILYKVIKKNELLRTFINEDLILKIFEPYSHKIPVITSIIFNDLKDEILENLKFNIFNNLLWEVYFIEDKNELYFFINHLITDQYSLGVLEKDILNITEGNELIYSNSFSEFVEYINENSRIDTLRKVAELGFRDVKKDDFFSIKYKNEVNYFKVETPYKSNYDNIVYGNYILSDLLCNSQNQKIISGSTIINIREFADKIFTNTFGDIHTTIPVIYKKENSFIIFKSIFDSIYNYFLSGDNLNNSVYKQYPYIPTNLKEYEYYLDDNLKFSSNFLGGIHKKELKNTIDELLKQQQSLENFSKNKLFITFFYCNSELIFVPITRNLLNF